MNVGCGPAFFIWALLLRSSAAQDLIPSTLRAPCEELNRSVLTQIASGHAKEAKSEVSAALSREPHEPGPACAGLTIINLAAFTALRPRAVDGIVDVAELSVLPKARKK